MRLELPNNWRPRPYQVPVWTALEGGIKRAVCLWHRRAGKDLCAIHWCATQAFQRPGLYWHVFPTYSQGRKVVWEGMDRAGRPFIDAFPDGSWYRKRDDDMTLWLHGGSKFQVVGTDHIDRLMGANPIGLIMSEYALQNPQAWELLSPILAENGGWAIFPYTPRGRNHGYSLFKYAEANPDRWFCQRLTVDETGAVPAEILAEEKERMPKEMFEQEYYCSFEASLVGAYYGEQLAWMRAQNPSRISDDVIWIPNKEVITAWDLGFGDATAIWFAQVIGNEVRVIDYYENSGEPIDHYVKILREKPYVYGDAYLPHDAGHTTLQTGRTTIEQLRGMGVRAILNPKIQKSDKIDATRLFLRQCWVAETACARGLQALAEYVKRTVEGERGPNNEPIYQDSPLRNWATHGADAMGELATGFRPERSTTFRQPDASWVR